MGNIEVDETKLAVLPCAPTLRAIVFPALVVKLVLGARYGVTQDQAAIEFEEARDLMHRLDFEVILRAAKRVRSHRPDKITNASVILLYEMARKVVAEEIFRPGTTRVIYYPSASPASAFYRCVVPSMRLNRGTRVVAYPSVTGSPREAIDYDVVVLQLDHRPTTLAFMKSLQQMGKKVIYEIDDAFDALEAWHPGYESYAKLDERARVFQMIREADAVTVSTKNLAERYADKAKRIKVVDNHVPLGAWPKAERHGTGEFRILWAGSPSHGGDLEVVRGPLEAFLKNHEEARLIFMGREPRGLDGFRERIRVLPFADFNAYPELLASAKADVAIAPLSDCPFNLGKSNLKCLEYGAAGYPIVASDVGPYRESIVPGRSGILCSTEREWVDALEGMAASPEDRRRLAAGSRELAMSHDAEISAPGLEDFFLGLVEAP